MTIHGWEKEDYENHFKCPSCSLKYGHHKTNVCYNCEECSKCCICDSIEIITAKEMIKIIKESL